MVIVIDVIEAVFLSFITAERLVDFSIMLSFCSSPDLTHVDCSLGY